MSWKIASRITFTTFIYIFRLLLTNTENVLRGLILISCVEPFLLVFLNFFVDINNFFYKPKKKKKKKKTMVTFLASLMCSSGN